jgi:hypothetical protein
MKATLTEEPALYTVEVNGHHVKGLRVAGELGPVRLLQNSDGEKIYIYDGSSNHAKAFRVFDEILGKSTAVDIVLIACSPSIMDEFTMLDHATSKQGE